MKTQIVAAGLLFVLTSCAGSGGTEERSNDSLQKSFQTASVEVGNELPNNGTRPEESICQPGSFVRVSTNTDACAAERFDVFAANGFLAERGFTDKEYYFFEPGTETYESPTVINSGLSLFGREVDGRENSACAFFCSTDNQTVTVFCTAPGEIVCGETVYARTADAPISSDPSSSSASDVSNSAVATSSSGSCSQASGSYSLDHVTCDPGLTLTPEQLGQDLTLEVSSSDDLNAAAVSLSEGQIFPGVSAESHYECSSDGSEVHIISTGSSSNLQVTCDYVFFR